MVMFGLYAMQTTVDDNRGTRRGEPFEGLQDTGYFRWQLGATFGVGRRGVGRT